MEERYYFAYGSNMNLEQMKYRCPAAEVVENVRLENYRLAFRGRAPGNGVATVLPEKGSCVEGVLWKITEACEKNLDFYEGFPSFYGKESIRVKNQDGVEKEVFVYMMNAPHKDVPAKPSKFYLDGILEGCKAVSYTHLDVYKRQPLRILSSQRLQKNIRRLRHRLCFAGICREG